jgi:hypothetical protein
VDSSTLSRGRHDSRLLDRPEASTALEPAPESTYPL